MWMSGRHPRETELNSDDVIEEQVFLHKPIAPEVLLRVVAEVLDGAPKDRA